MLDLSTRRYQKLAPGGLFIADDSTIYAANRIAAVPFLQLRRIFTINGSVEKTSDMSVCAWRNHFGEVAATGTDSYRSGTKDSRFLPRTEKFSSGQDRCLHLKTVCRVAVWPGSETAHERDSDAVILAHSGHNQQWYAYRSMARADL